MTTHGVYDDPDVRAGLDWLASVSGDASGFRARLEQVQERYRKLTAAPEKLGADPDFGALGPDVVSAYFAQAKSMLDDSRSFDFTLASHVVPWVKRLGKVCSPLGQVTGSVERAARMLQARAETPDTAMFELVMAGNYAAEVEGTQVAFIDEKKGGPKTPDLRVRHRASSIPVSVELKRLRSGDYETAEQRRQKELFAGAANYIDARQLSIVMDVTYTRELVEVPDGWLAERLDQARTSPVATPGGYTWKDRFGFGTARPANLLAAHQDIRANGPLWFGTKLARLLSGHPVHERRYNMVADAKSSEIDPRFIERMYHGSVLTWQCVAQKSIQKKARYLQSKIAEADRQLVGHGPGIIHLALDAELHCQSSDLRRKRNIGVVETFAWKSAVREIVIHYLAPRISESHTWLVDETMDLFNPEISNPVAIPIFPDSEPVRNELPAWRQELPLPAK